jgi:serine protease Do
MCRLFKIILLACILAPTLAQAQGNQVLGLDQQYAQVSWWTIGYNSGHGGCLMAASYPSHNSFPATTVWVGFHKDKENQLSAFLALTSPSWAAEIKKEYSFHLQLDQYGFIARGYGVTWRDEKGFLVIGVSDTFLRALGDSDRMIISVAGLVANVLSLAGSRDAMAKLVECQRQSPAIAANLPKVPESNEDDGSSRYGTNRDSEKTKYGTGFFVSEQGHILTNNHVAEGCGVLTVHSSTGEQQQARLVRADKTNDLALLITEMKPSSIAEFQPDVNIGEKVFAFGYPLVGFLSPSGTFTDGSISSLAGILDDTRMLQISAPVQPGNSGGPLLNEKGQW